MQVITAGPITGTTRTVPLLAYPAAHVRTPFFANPELERRHIDALVIPWQVAPVSLAAVVTGMRASQSVAGMLVTVPHKKAAAALCDELVDDSGALATINVIRRYPDGRLTGGNLDGYGFVTGLLAAGHDLNERDVLLLGAGGAAAAIALAVARQPIHSLTIANRGQDKAEQLAAVVGRLTGARVSTRPRAAEGYDVIINATSLGMHADDPPPLEAKFHPRQLVAEVVMQPPVTRLLQAAQAGGARIHPGEHMIRTQVPALIEFIFGDAR